jgi:hypothetical protein
MARRLTKNYVPFVDVTEAPNERVIFGGTPGFKYPVA